MRGPAIVDPRAGAWKIRFLDQAFRCGWRLCSVPNESWVARGPGASPAWLVLVGGAPLLGISAPGRPPLPCPHTPHITMVEYHTSAHIACPRPRLPVGPSGGLGRKTASCLRTLWLRSGKQRKATFT